jgi:iron complex transport system permease protein
VESVQSRRRGVAHVASGLAVLAAVSFFSLQCGATYYSVADVFTNTSVSDVIWKLRFPRILLAIVVGGGLSLVGAMYQSLFRNPLASPFSLGVSSGAALGASLAVVWGLPGLLGGKDVGFAAIVGALVSITVISALSRREGSGDRLLLVGVVFSFLCSSGLTLIQYLADYSQLFRVTRWLMGGVPAATLNDVAVGALLVALVLLFGLRESRSYDLFLYGDDLARTKGVNTHRVRHRSFVVTSLFVGWVVAHCGVIGFVGIIVPAVARLFVGIGHKTLLPVSFLFGAILVVGCDLLGRVVSPPFEVPAGVFTALIGGPVFIALLLNSKARGRLIA